MFKQTPNAMQNGSSSLRPQPTQAYDTSLQSFAPQVPIKLKAHGRDTVHCTWTDVYDLCRDPCQYPVGATKCFFLCSP